MRRTGKNGELRPLESAVAILFFSAALLSCGGAQKVTVEVCRARGDKILALDDAELCDAEMVNRFETRVATWQRECSAHATAQSKEKLKDKWVLALTCAEDKERIEAKSQNCAKRLADIEEGRICLGDECAPYMDELNSIALDCNDEQLSDDYDEKASKEISRFKERVNHPARFKKFRDLMSYCDGLVDMAADTPVEKTLGRVIKKVSKNKNLRKKFEKDSEMDRFKLRTLAACGMVIQTALAIICESALEQIASNPKTKKRQRKKLNGLKRRLRKVKPETLFPGSTDVLKETLETLSD